MLRLVLASEHIRMELDQMKIPRGWSHGRSLITTAARLVFLGTMHLALCLQMQGMKVTRRTENIWHYITHNELRVAPEEYLVLP